MHLKSASDALVSPRRLTLRTRGFAPDEVAFIMCVLNDAKGWRAYGFSFELVPWAAPADFDVHLTEDAGIVAAFPPSFGGMSVTDRRGARPVVHLNATNWRVPPPTSGYPATASGVARYRTYVINHEVGHVLGLGHATCRAAGAPAPVMVQQTRGCGECVPDPWVVKS